MNPKNSPEYNVFGYMTLVKAKEFGFTNHGKYFGVPVWLADMDDGEGMMVATKWMPFEYIFPALYHIEGFLRNLFFPDDDPCFQFSIGKEI